MENNLCTDCQKEDNCFEPFPHEECDDFERKVRNSDIIRLFWGMSKTMQNSIIQIMEITQERKK